MSVLCKLAKLKKKIYGVNTYDQQFIYQQNIKNVFENIKNVFETLCVYRTIIKEIPKL